MTTIYLSSTYEDLKDHRQVVFEALRKVDHPVIAMEGYVAADQRPVDKCLRDVEKADIYVGLFAFRYGYVPPIQHNNPKGLSITELEFRHAETCKKPCLTFMMKEDAAISGKFVDAVTGEGDRGEQIKQLRDHLLKEKLTGQFESPHELATLVLAAVTKQLDENKIPELAISKNQLKRIEWPEDKSPYPGLVWFDREYASLYCGQDRDIDAVIAKMAKPENRFLIIRGASGSGKSSLVGAGVWRALIHEERFPGSRNWKWCRMLPGDGERTPFQGLAWALKQTFSKITERPDHLAKQLAENSRGLQEIVMNNLDGNRELVLCLDQMEELFTRGFKDADIKIFLDHLIEIAQAPQSHLRVLATIRSDFGPHLEQIDSILQLLNAGSIHFLGPITPLALAEMITKPAVVTGYEFEPELVNAILRDAAQEPGNLPLVAYTLKQLFERREGRMFTRKAYEAIGGVAGSIGTKADQVMEKLGEITTDSFDRVFAELVHIERDGTSTRKRAFLNALNDDKEAVELIQALAGSGCRVLITGKNEQGPTVEVAHEQLFTAWPRLRDWIERSKDDLRDIEHATEEARRWRERGENAEELWPFSRAKEVLIGLERFGKSPSPDLRRFLSPQSVLFEKLEQDTLTHEMRAIIGWKLGVGLRKDGLPDIAWIEIPGGQVKLEKFDYVFKVKSFLLAKYPVTNMQFEAFLQADDGYLSETWWQGYPPPEFLPPQIFDEPNCPRVGVSWYEAIASCRWLSYRTGLTIRLPNEWEWQQAATGGDPSYKYPWGKKWDHTRCNNEESGLDRTVSVGLYPNGATLQGAMDLAGNVYEWCLNTLYKYLTVSPESITLNDLRDRGIRGGYYNDRCPEISRRMRSNPEEVDPSGGFRLVQDMT